MKKLGLLLGVLVTFGGCAAPVPAGDGDADAIESVDGPTSEEVGQVQQALAADPFQGIFALRPTTTGTGFLVNPIGTFSLTCPDGIVRQECAVNRLDFAPSGLGAAQEAALRTRIASEPLSEASVSVLAKGVFVRLLSMGVPVRVTYAFRISAAYRAPSVRSHGSTLRYVVEPATASDGFQRNLYVNSDLAGAINIPYEARVPIGWSGPAAERPASIAQDSFVSIAHISLVPGMPQPQFLKFVDMVVDQSFVRVTN